MVFEFPPGKHEWQLRDVAAALGRNTPQREIRFCAGFLHRYRPGGLTLSRMLNLGWVHVRAAMTILTGRWTCIIVRTSPPLIQMTVGLACRWRGIPYGVWLMDAHPELEAEAWGRKPLIGALCRWLARRNAVCLNRAEFVVVLDEAMRKRLVPTALGSQVVVCPTWGVHQPRIESLPQVAATAGRVLRFVYLGNLGLAHDIPALVRFLNACAVQGRVTITFYGTAVESVAVVVQALAREVEWEGLPGVPFEQLREVLSARGFDFGLVALKPTFSGLLSPSKYIGYLAAGVPLVYLGPPRNNSANVCDQLHAGIRLDGAAPDETVIGRLHDPEFRRRVRENTPAALEYFGQFNGEYLADQIDSRLAGAQPTA